MTDTDDAAPDADPAATPAPQPFRMLPALDDTNREFWTGGEHGELRIWRCQACGHWIHPPSPRCPICLSKDLAVEPVSGKAVLHTYTVNHQPWYPGLEPPYVIAIVALPEQDGLRLTTALVDIAMDDVAIGMPLAVQFERYDDVWLPFFGPDPEAAS
ncbi:MAG TPA: OB-fold domain-containing protein [Acidimicrobiales bacterium]